MITDIVAFIVLSFLFVMNLRYKDSTFNVIVLCMLTAAMIYSLMNIMTDAGMSKALVRHIWEWIGLIFFISAIAGILFGKLLKNR